MVLEMRNLVHLKAQGMVTTTVLDWWGYPKYLQHKTNYSMGQDHFTDFTRKCAHPAVVRRQVHVSQRMPQVINTQMYSLFTLRKLRSPLILDGNRGFVRANRL